MISKIQGYYFITDAALSKAGNISDIKNAVEAGVGVIQYRNKSGSTKEMIEEALKLKKLCQIKNDAPPLTPPQRGGGHDGVSPSYEGGVRGGCNGAIFLINDRVDIAIAVNADGVHLGQDDMPYEIARKLLDGDKPSTFESLNTSQNTIKQSITKENLDKDFKKVPGKIIGITVHNLDEAIAAEKMGADYLGVSPIFSTSTKKDAGKPCGVILIKEIKKVCKIPIVAIGGINYENAKEVIVAGADALCAMSAVVAKDNIQEEIKKFQKLFKITATTKPH
jgi:thiamine-phosphate pyrophosphorylase